jgi:hypothetical protein
MAMQIQVGLGRSRAPRRVYRLVGFALLLGVVLGLAAPAPAVTFDFDFLPDSAGCAQPVPAGGDHSACDPDWVSDWEAGILEEHSHTLEGLTLTLSTTGVTRSTPHDQAGYVDWGYAGGQIQCGNSFDCFPYLADFSTGLSDAQVEFLGVESEGASVEPLLYYLEAYAGAGGTGALLASVSQAGPGPTALLGLTAPPGTQIRSLVFGVESGCIGTDCDSLLQDNTGIIGQLIVTIPEPISALLVASGLLALAGRRRRLRASSGSTR